jgi:hypothetical protein
MSLVKIFILALCTEVVFASSYIQRMKLRDERARAEKAQKQAYALKQFCNIQENFHVLPCVTLRENEQRLAQFKEFCSTNGWTGPCISYFGPPQPWGFICNAISFLVIFFLVFVASIPLWAH